MATEISVLKALVSRAIARGLVVSVNDGESWPVKKSTDIQAIVEAATGVDESSLRFRDSVTGESVGFVYLVFGNSPEDLIADHTDSPVMAALVAGL